MVIRTPYGNRFGSVFGSRFFNAHETSSTPLVLDPDAETYIAAVESADGQELELAVKVAYNNFILGCKSDGIWSAIETSCILAGARTVNGALTPLKGTSPTNYNFTLSDYDRKNGLTGNASNKAIDTNRAPNSFARNNMHVACYMHSLGTSSSDAVFGGHLYDSGSGDIALYFVNPTTTGVVARAQSVSTSSIPVSALQPGLYAISMTGGVQYKLYLGATNLNVNTQTYIAGDAYTIMVMSARNATNQFFRASNSTCFFYSLGTGIDLGLLEIRIAQLKTDINNAIS